MMNTNKELCSFDKMVHRQKRFIVVIYRATHSYRIYKL